MEGSGEHGDSGASRDAIIGASESIGAAVAGEQAQAQAAAMTAEGFTVPSSTAIGPCSASGDLPSWPFVITSPVVPVWDLLDEAERV